MSDLYVIARIAGQRVAFAATEVEAVLDLARVVPAPLAPTHVRGLAAARSRVLTVIDGGLAVGHGAVAGERALVVERGGHAYAIAVDAVEDVGAPSGRRDSVDAGVGAEWRRCAMGTIDGDQGFALVIDADRLIAGPEKAAA